MVIFIFLLSIKMITNDTEKNKTWELIGSNTTIPTSNEVWEHLSDMEFEPSAWGDVAWNFENELSSNELQKNELLEELHESNKAMKSEIEKLTKIAATSQSQYISLKNEFDSYVRRIDWEKKEIKIIELKKIVSKFAKLLEQFRLFLSHLDHNLKENNQIKWLQLIYESFLGQELAQMWVFQIISLWLTPDSDLHEVLMIQPATEKELQILRETNIKLDGEKEHYNIDELKGHIISEFEVWYYYFDGEKKIVIKPSKVMVAE